LTRWPNAADNRRVLHLPDVSEFQPNVDWGQVVQDTGGAAIIRAMCGTSHVDRAWYNGARRADAHEKGMRSGSTSTS
jgi:GH25 family lysozyme M1 (1,4-beta-N-acetylmuramidase)